MKNFIHLVGAADAREVVVVDPAWNVPGILEEVARDSKELVAVVLTHSHADHINGLGELLAARPMPVYAQRAEIEGNARLAPHAAALTPVAPGQRIQIGPLEATLIHTPGHTPGSQCLHCGGALFSGDTLFVEACGRCDLPGGDAAQLFDSLHHVLGALPDETQLYPGHDYGSKPVSNLAHERKHNPYLTRSDRQAFIDYRLRPRS